MTSNSISESGKIALEYIKRFPTYPSRQLANIIYTAVPGVFSSVEHARGTVRYYRGAKGVKNRQELTREHYLPRINIPQSDTEAWEPLELSASDFPIIAIGDLQIPFHDQDVVEMALERAVEIKAKTILIMGDFTDCYQLSYFLRDPRKRNYKEEVALTHEIIASIRKAMGNKVRIIWKKGNHEFRLDSYIMRQAPEIYGLDVMSFSNIYHLPEYKVELVDDKRIIRYRQLSLLHGHEYRGGVIAPVNPARTLFLKAKRSAAWWHFHRPNAHTDKAINDDTITCWSVGCMCGLHPEFMPLNDWQHGFAEIYVDADGYWTFRNRKIIGYRYTE